MKLRCMISKLILKSMQNSRKRVNSHGWTWTRTKMSTALKCTYRTSPKWWKSKTNFQRALNFLIDLRFKICFSIWIFFLVFATSLRLCRFWLVQYPPMWKPHMVNCWHRIWPIRRICSLYHRIFAIGANASAIHTMMKRVDQFTNLLNN